MSQRRELVLDTVWAMERGQLNQLRGLYEAVSNADPSTLVSIRQVLADARRVDRADSMPGNMPMGSDCGACSYTVDKGVATIHFEGVVTKKPTCMGSLLGGDAVTADLVKAIDAAAADPAVHQIALVIDSPGGTAAGTASAAEAVWRARQQKPVTAFAEDTAASAAYWIASQATRVVANSTAAIGSIGVYGVLPDSSRRAENSGVRMHVVKAGEFKGAGVPGTHVTDSQLAEMQREIDGVYEEFLAGVARGRGISVDQARALGDGRVHPARAALELGLIDGVMELRDLMAELQAPPAADPQAAPVASVLTFPNRNPRAEVVPDPPALKEAPMSEPTPTAQPVQAAAQADSNAEILAQLRSISTRLESVEGRATAAENGVTSLVTERGLEALLTEARHATRLNKGNEAYLEPAIRAAYGKSPEAARLFVFGDGTPANAGLPQLGPGEGSLLDGTRHLAAVPQASGQGTAPQRHRFDVYGYEAWGRSDNPVMQRYGRKIQWIEANERTSGVKFKNAGEAFAAYDRANPSAA